LFKWIGEETIVEETLLAEEESSCSKWIAEEIQKLL
jgi:hypothetical protein